MSNPNDKGKELILKEIGQQLTALSLKELLAIKNLIALFTPPQSTAIQVPNDKLDVQFDESGELIEIFRGGKITGRRSATFDIHLIESDGSLDSMPFKLESTRAIPILTGGTGEFMVGCIIIDLPFEHFHEFDEYEVIENNKTYILWRYDWDATYIVYVVAFPCADASLFVKYAVRKPTTTAEINWAVRSEKIRKLFNEGMSDVQIAMRCFVSSKTVARQRMAMGLHRQKKRKSVH